jgi:Flp pilus assembly protein TadG
MRIVRALQRSTGRVHRDTGGQTAIAFVLTLLFIFTLFALAFDAGVWFFDHRTAQNQSEAAALAATQYLPAADTTAAAAAADEALVANGSDASERSCLEFEDRNGDGRYETARVCVERNSAGVFSNLSGVTFVTVSAAATATIGPVDIANVMPWGVVPPDPTCDEIGEVCENDLDGDGTLEVCGAYLDCPWGLPEDQLYAFKVSGTITPGNFGAIAACGNGAVNYVECINGELVSGFYEEGETVEVETQTGNLGQNTNSALTDRYPASTWAACDVAGTPDPATGLDPDGHADAIDRYVDDPVPGCEQRLVMVPIILEFPQGSSDDITVLGVGVFAIASWDRTAPWGDAEGTDADECGTAAGGGYACGMVWGYFMQDARPPEFLLERIGDTDNPFAPLLIALVE